MLSVDATIVSTLLTFVYLSVCLSVCLFVCLLAKGWSGAVREVPCGPKWTWEGCACVCTRQHGTL